MDYQVFLLSKEQLNMDVDLRLATLCGSFCGECRSFKIETCAGCGYVGVLGRTYIITNTTIIIVSI